MPKIIKNYIENDGNFELLDEPVVYADMPIVIVDRFKKYKKLFVYNNQAFEYDEFHKVNKLYKLSVKETGEVFEDAKGQIAIYLPKDVDLSELRLTPDGQVVRITPTGDEDIEVLEEEGEE